MRTEEAGGLKDYEIDYLKLLKRKESRKNHWSQNDLEYGGDGILKF